jgi:spatacsin
VKGVFPHALSDVNPRKPTEWRSPIFTSKNDMEIHDLIQKHFHSLDFSKIFTEYYGRTPGQPNFLHFDHPEFIATSVEPPYLYYVKLLLPVTAFQQAVNDKIFKEQFQEICWQLVKDSFADARLELATLSFIELTDFHFGTNTTIDYKSVLHVYNRLFHVPWIVDDLIPVFRSRNKENVMAISENLNPQDLEGF